VSKDISWPGYGHSNVIEKIKLLAAKKVIWKGKGRHVLTCTCSRFFSLLWMKGRWRRRPVVVSVSQDISWPGDGAQQSNRKNKIISCKKLNLKRERRGKSHLRLRSLLLFAVEERVLAMAARNCVCGSRYQLARGWCFSM
jgi:hypothetical protein